MPGGLKIARRTLQAGQPFRTPKIHHRLTIVDHQPRGVAVRFYLLQQRFFHGLIRERILPSGRR